MLPTDFTWRAALQLILAGILLGVGWALAQDVVAFVKGRAGTIWDLIVIVIVIIVIIVVIFL